MSTETRKHTPRHAKRTHKKVPLISIQMASKTYAEDPLDFKTLVLKNIYLEIFEGEFVTIFGPSGSGKSTMLNLIAGLEKPTAGRVLVRRRDLAKFDSDELAQFHRRKMGFVFQNFNLIKSLNVWENVALPQTASGVNYGDRKRKALKLLNLFHLDQYANRHPNELSGGEQQRVAIARALINDPYFLLVDEPTGNLDSKSAEDVMNILQDIHTKEKHTIILVTHNPNQLKYATRVIYMEDGQVVIEENRDDKEGERKSTRLAQDHTTITSDDSPPATSPTAATVLEDSEPLETDTIHTKITGDNPIQKLKDQSDKPKSSEIKNTISKAPDPETTSDQTPTAPPAPALKKPADTSQTDVKPEKQLKTDQDSSPNTEPTSETSTKTPVPPVETKPISQPQKNTPKPSTTSAKNTSPSVPDPSKPTPNSSKEPKPAPTPSLPPTELVNDDVVKTVMIKGEGDE